MHRRSLLVSLSGVLALLAGCPSGGSPAQVIQQPVPTVAGAEGKPASGGGVAACKGGERHELMVIDWQPETRGDLEVAMKEGLALVQYDCKTIKLVSACSLAGTYGYIGTTRREKKIEMASDDEVAANLPVGGLTWLSDVGGKIDRERALLAQLVMIGKRSSAKKQAARTDLEGGCETATHFVRAATVGAFTVAAGSKAEIAASAKLVGKGAAASSKSSTKIEAQDGDLAACEKSTPDDKTAPGQCGAVLRIELEPIGGDAPAADPALAVAACPPGLAQVDGACRRPSVPHQCAPGDAAGCTTQCEAGYGGSCATLAAMYRTGVGTAKDFAKAAATARLACDKDAMDGCRLLAMAQLAGEGMTKNKPAAIALLDRACAAGNGASCVELGVAKLADKKLAGDAQYAFRRACYGGGEFDGCAWLGTLYADGKGGMNESPKLAAKFFEKGCDEGSQRACTGLADLLRAGKGVAKDAAKATALYTKACDAGHEPACRKK